MTAAISAGRTPTSKPPRASLAAAALAILLLPWSRSGAVHAAEGRFSNFPWGAQTTYAAHIPPLQIRAGMQLFARAVVLHFGR